MVAKTQARKALAKLTARELEILLIAANPDNSVFGGATDIIVTVTTVTKKLDKAGRCRTKATETRTRTPERKVLDSLVRRGWLRSVWLDRTTAHYLLTDNARKMLAAR